MLKLCSATIPALENEINLCILLGFKLLFNITSDLPHKLEMIVDSAFSLCKQIEILRNHLILSLSHDISSGRSLFLIDQLCGCKAVHLLS